MVELRFYRKDDYQLVDTTVVRERFFEQGANLHAEALWERALNWDEEVWDLIEGLCDAET
jgi:hypothetical protein